MGAVKGGCWHGVPALAGRTSCRLKAGLLARAGSRAGRRGRGLPDSISSDCRRPDCSGTSLTAKHLLCRPLVTFPRLGAEADEQDFLNRGVARQKLLRLRQSNARGALERETIRAGADAGEGDGSDGVTGRQFQAVAVAACQEIVFAARAVLPDGTDGVNDPFGRE